MSPNPSEPAFDELLEQLKSELPEPLFVTVSEKFLALKTYQNKLQYAELKIQVLEERLRLKRIEKYGPGSETLTKEQLELLELEPGVSTAEVQFLLVLFHEWRKELSPSAQVRIVCG